jgi:hypothetical protein
MRFKQGVLFLAFALAACAHVETSTYEGRGGDKVVEGQGGTKRVDDGIEIWDSGEPPHRYKVIGMSTIADFDNVFGRARIESAIVAQAKAANANGVILLDQTGGGQSVGFAAGSNGAFAAGGGFNRKTLRVLLVKYLDLQ